MRLVERPCPWECFASPAINKSPARQRHHAGWTFFRFSLHAFGQQQAITHATIILLADDHPGCRKGGARSRWHENDSLLAKLRMLQPREHTGSSGGTIFLELVRSVLRT